MAGERSPRRGRLSRSADFDRVLRSGRSHAGPELVLYVFPRGGVDTHRLGLSVSRKVGGAVQRNLVKRLLRDAFAAEQGRLPAGMDAVVIARRGASELAARSGPAGIRNALAALVDKVPGAAPPTGVDGAVEGMASAGEERGVDEGSVVTEAGSGASERSGVTEAGSGAAGLEEVVS